MPVYELPQLLLDKLLKRRGISRYQFARMREKDEKNLRRTFNSKAYPKFSEMIEWAETLKVDVRVFIRKKGK